jgi:amino acid permease
MLTKVRKMSVNTESAPLLVESKGDGSFSGGRRVIPSGGSLLGGTVNMTKSLFGAGVLAMPHAFTQTGMLLGAVLYMALGLVVVAGNVLLLKIERTINFSTSPPKRLNSLANYADVAAHIYGEPGRIAIEVSVILLEV